MTSVWPHYGFNDLIIIDLLSNLLFEVVSQELTLVQESHSYVSKSETKVHSDLKHLYMAIRYGPYHMIWSILYVTSQISPFELET